jgi:hypothetical protein
VYDNNLCTGSKYLRDLIGTTRPALITTLKVPNQQEARMGKFFFYIGAEIPVVSIDVIRWTILSMFRVIDF